MLLKGIDVSKHNGTINWKKVKESGRVQFAILRAGYGKLASQKDVQFENNYAGCKANHIPCGVYWYSYATTVSEAQQEAKVLLSIIKGKTFEYPIYFDVEENSQFRLGKTAVSNIIDAFCSTVEKAGYWVGLYMSKSYLENYTTSYIRQRYAIWVAQYSKTCTYSGQYGMWQYGIAVNRKYNTFNEKTIPGISGEIDLDYCYVDYEDKIKFLALNGFSFSNTTETPKTEEQEKTVNTTENSDKGEDTVPSYTVYTVKKNDTLWKIAQTYLKNGNRYREIMTLNGLKTTTIYPNQRLKVPTE